MFTGIVQGLAEVISIEHLDSLKRIGLRLPKDCSEDFKIGASIAVAGTCLTISAFSQHDVYFDVIQQTLIVTNLTSLRVGDSVNFERAARFNDEIGGHLLSGHIMNTAEVSEVIHSENNCQVWFNSPPSLRKYVMDKGFIALNGCSLTIASIEDDRFCVHLIPETLSVTSFAHVKAGDIINIEIDHQTQTIVDTVERMLNSSSLKIAQ